MTSQLAQRIALTIGALLLFRLGSYIPLPGVNPEAWEILTRSQGGGVAAVFGASSGGARRLAIFALGIIPYVSAAVLVQLATIFSRRLRARAREGERGRAAMVRYARYLTVLLTAFQAWGVADGLEHVSGVVAAPGPLFIVSTVITLTGGTLFLAWLAEQITARGVGNGVALILFAGIVTDIPASIAYALEAMRQTGAPGSEIILVLLIVIAVTAAVVTIELARRRLPVRYAARDAGARRLDERESNLSIKLNPAGIVPVLLASFVAGAMLSIVDRDQMSHPQFQTKLQALGYGFLIPVFFISSGLQFDVSSLTSPASLAKVPIFVAALLLVRGLPAAVYLRSVSPRRALAAGLLQATSLPFIVAATQIGLVLRVIQPSTAAALVAAGLVSVIAFPALALAVTREPTPKPAGSTPTPVEDGVHE